MLADGGWMLGPGHTWATQGAYLHKQTHTRTCVRIHRYRCIHVYMYLHINISINKHTYAYTYTYICTYTYTYTYTYTCKYRCARMDEHKYELRQIYTLVTMKYETE